MSIDTDNMNLSSHCLTPEQIVKGNDRFNIPLYQRLFAWTHEEILKLLIDIENAPDDKPYYIGALSAIYNPEVSRYDLIDGQQRFTVLMLMGITFKNEHEGWNKFLANGQRIQFSGRPEDEEYIGNRILGTLKESDYRNCDMEKGLETISDFLQKIGEYRRMEFINKCYEKITFFISELPGHYVQHPESLNRYFEVMNTAGRSLEAHEILKVKLLINQPDSARLNAIWNAVSDFSKRMFGMSSESPKSELTKIYKEYLTNGFNPEQIEDNDEPMSIDIIPERAVEESGNSDSDAVYDSIINFQEFLLLVLSIFKKRKGCPPEKQEWFSKDKLLSAFYPDSNPNQCVLASEDIPEFYELMLRCRMLLDLFVIRREIRSGQIVSYDLLLDVDDENGKKYNKKLCQYEAMLYSSHLGEAFSRWLPQLIETVDADIQIPVSGLLVRIKEIDNGNHDAQQLSLSQLSYPGVSTYYFSRLDYYLWEKLYDIDNKDTDIVSDNIFGSLNKEEKNAVLNFMFRRNRSREHLHPQHQARNTVWNGDVLNGFGNLALISSSFNSIQSDDEVEVKFARIRSQVSRNEGGLESIKMLLMMKAANGDEKQWNEDIAQKHGEQMFEFLKLTYNDSTLK